MPNTYASVKNRANGSGRAIVPDKKMLKKDWVTEVIELLGFNVTGLDRLTVDSLKQMHHGLTNEN